MDHKQYYGYLSINRSIYLLIFRATYILTLTFHPFLPLSTSQHKHCEYLLHTTSNYLAPNPPCPFLPPFMTITSFIIHSLFIHLFILTYPPSFALFPFPQNPLLSSPPPPHIFKIHTSSRYMKSYSQSANS